MKNPPSAVIVLKALFHLTGIFILPLGMVLVSSLLFGASEVSSTYTMFFLISMIFVVPSFIALIISTIIKIQRDWITYQKGADKQEKEMSPLIFFFDSMGRHAALLTVRGWGTMIGAMTFVFASITVGWASLGTVATFLMLLLYLVLGIAALVSTFMVGAFSQSRKSAGIHREVIPAVVLRGDEAEERFVLNRVPVPLGFVLFIEDKNPMVLDTVSRYAAAASAKEGMVTLRGVFRKTPRGLHKLGPAHIWYQDALGLTQISVSSTSTTWFKCLPNIRPVDIQEAPRSSVEAPDILCTPHRFPTEDYFRFKEYHPGDDTRRIHWGLSIRTGQFQVRKPETKERTVDSILLVLDNFLPNNTAFPDLVEIEEILDALVEVWLSLASRLKDQGHKVSLVAIADNGRGTLESSMIHCDKQSFMQWQDLGSRVRWQEEMDVDRLAMSLDEGTHLVVISSRTVPPPSLPIGRSLTWVYLPPMDVVPDDPRTFWETLVGAGPGFWRRVAKGVLFLPYPTGTEENTIRNQLRKYTWMRKQYQMKKLFRMLAKRSSVETYAAIMSQSTSVYKLQQDAGVYRLIGVRGDS